MYLKSISKVKKVAISLQRKLLTSYCRKPKVIKKFEPKVTNNPEPYSIKPKAFRLQLYNDVLGLEKFKGAVKPLVANYYINILKMIPDNIIDLTSDYELAILKKIVYFMLPTMVRIYLTLGGDFVKL